MLMIYNNSLRGKSYDLYFICIIYFFQLVSSCPSGGGGGVYLRGIPRGECLGGEGLGGFMIMFIFCPFGCTGEGGCFSRLFHNQCPETSALRHQHSERRLPSMRQHNSVYY